MTEPTTPEDVLRHLKDVDYPADKEALVAAAERAHAPATVIRALRAIPPVEYRNAAEVRRSVGADPAADRSASRAAAQARTRVRPGIAEHMREPR